MNYTQSSFVIVCHDSVFGPPHELRDFLLGRKAKSVLFIGHQNRYVTENPVKSSYCEVYERGTQVMRCEARHLELPEFVQYARDMLLTLVWTVRFSRKTDHFIGLGNLNAFAGLLLRIPGIVHNVYYYVIDYLPQRFGNPVMNSIYHALDRLCATWSTSTWNYADAMIIARNEHWNTRFPRQKIVPNGIRIRPELIASQNTINRYELIYLGTLYEQQGIQCVIGALPYIAEHLQDITLTLIGQGPYRKNLESLIRDKGVGKRVRFLGFIEDPIIMERRLSKAALGVGMYRPGVGFVAYTEPGKIKRYLAVGVPVVMTDISPIAKDLVRHRCGMISSYDSRDFAAKVITFLKDEKKVKTFRVNAVSYAKKYEWDSIFERAFQ
jgi:glycosyltransferase involved in cell wall biosynthesis